MTNFNLMETIAKAHQIENAMSKSFDVDFDFSAAFSGMIFRIEFFLKNPSEFFADAAHQEVLMACMKGEIALEIGTEKELTSQALATCYTFRDAMNGNTASLIAQEN